MIANLLPPAVRRAVYIILGVAVGLEAVWDVVPDALEGRLLQSLTVLGFVLAAGNTSTDTNQEG